VVANQHCAIGSVTFKATAVAATVLLLQLVVLSVLLLTYTFNQCTQTCYPDGIYPSDGGHSQHHAANTSIVQVYNQA
jgi:hypothetical protein